MSPFPPRVADLEKKWLAKKFASPFLPPLRDEIRRSNVPQQLGK